MKFFKGLISAILLVLLLASTAVTLLAGAVRFLALNPAFLKTFLTTKPYCNAFRESMVDELDTTAAQYGLDDAAFDACIQDDDVKSYTSALIDALYAADGTTDVALPAFPMAHFEEYLRSNPAFETEQAVSDCLADCSAVIADNTELTLVANVLASLQVSLPARYSILLFVGGLALTLLMVIFLSLVHVRSKRAGGVLVFGGLFLGTTVAFVPVWQFVLFGYVDRVAYGVSIFRTFLTSWLNTILYGAMFLLLGLLVLFGILLLVAIIRAAKGKKKPRRAENNA